MKNFVMTSDEAILLYKWFEENDISIWIDGGWCVDALLGFETRKHDDLDIVVNRKDNLKLYYLLKNKGYEEEKRDDSCEHNYVMRSKGGQLIDIHVFEYNQKGENIYGAPYPFGSLTGKGKINGELVNCISAEWMFKFKLWANNTNCEPRKKDIIDAQVLSKKYGFKLPSNYMISINK